MKFTAIVFAAVTLGQIPSGVAICGGGEVGIGRKQIYQWQGQNNVLVSDNWNIVANNCNTIAVSDKGFKADPCSAGPSYGSGNGINGCDGSGKPGFVWTNGGNFHNCYSIGSSSCATGPFIYNPVYWCCQRW